MPLHERPTATITSNSVWVGNIPGTRVIGAHWAEGK